MDILPALGSKSLAGNLEKRLAKVDTGRASQQTALLSEERCHLQVDGVERVDGDDLGHLLNVPAGSTADVNPDLLLVLALESALFPEMAGDQR